MNRQVVALLSGVLFALGLGVSGMTQPQKVLGFLDVFDGWDPSLAFVMAGAIAAHLPFAVLTRRAGARPAFAAHYVMPTSTRVDARLIVGAALFGLGWGMAGYCPGPAIVSLVALSPATLLFVLAMLAGMLLHDAVLARRSTPREPDESALTSDPQQR